MFPILSLYLVAAVQLFQGLQLLGAPGTPLGVVPPEVVPAPAPSLRWGRALAASGTLLVLLGLLAQVRDGWTDTAMVGRNVAGALEIAYGLWLLFGRKVDFRPAAPASTPSHPS